MTALHEYLNNDRHYHTFEHVGKMFEDLRLYFPEYQQETALKYAILYHDCIYTPGSLYNESESARRAYAETEHLEESIRNKVNSLIRLTEDHECHDDDELGKVLIDLDLCRLASNDYQMNSILIRKELFIAKDEEWRSGRIKWLNSFLARDSIYLTSLSKSKFEALARNNMENELQYLKGFM